jgi:ribokinase
MITVIGDALLDVHVVPSEAPRPGGDVPAEIRLEPGGQGANVAVRLARQGRRVRLICAIGTDVAGNLLRERIAADGVELVDAGARTTGAVVVLLDSRRERTMLSQRVALGPGIASLPELAEGWLVVSGYLLLETEASVRAAGARRRVLLGCSLDPSGAAAWLEQASALAPHLVILNTDEARIVAGAESTPAELAQQLADRLAAIVVVTHPAGAAAAPGGASVDLGGSAAGPIVDATGAGDALAAGLIAGLVEETWPPSPERLRRALDSATNLAAAVARVPGAQARVEQETG